LIARAGRNVEDPAAGPNLGQSSIICVAGPWISPRRARPRFLRSATSLECQFISVSLESGGLLVIVCSSQSRTENDARNLLRA
jgi:hypothetical protein